MIKVERSELEIRARQPDYIGQGYCNVCEKQKVHWLVEVTWRRKSIMPSLDVQFLVCDFCFYDDIDGVLCWAEDVLQRPTEGVERNMKEKGFI